MAIFETFFYIGSAISVAVVLFGVLPTLFINKILSKKRG